MILTGGWDGKNRTSEVSAFNLKTSKWLTLRHLEDLSRPPFGLSGHSCTMIRSSLFCVLGREGGLKIQRRFGDIFLLHINIDTDNHVGTYYWKEAPVKTKSRSGHTALLAPSLRFGGDLYGLFVFGGRENYFQWWKKLAALSMFHMSCTFFTISHSQLCLFDQEVFFYLHPRL